MEKEIRRLLSFTLREGLRETTPMGRGTGRSTGAGAARPGRVVVSSLPVAPSRTLGRRFGPPSPEEMKKLEFALGGSFSGIGKPGP